MKILSATSLVTAAALAIGGPHAGRAEDVYYVKRIDDLKLEHRERLDDAKGPQRRSERDARSANPVYSRAALDGEGEVYVGSWPSSEPNEPMEVVGQPPSRAAVARERPRPGPTVAIRVAERRNITGWLFTSERGRGGSDMERFSIAAEDGAAKYRSAFLDVKRSHYQNLLNRDIPGAAWFRRQVREATAQLYESPLNLDDRRRRPMFGVRRGSGMEETFALVSGGRALSENLQLDRALPTSKVEAPRTPIGEIEGVTVREFDWAPRVQGLRPDLDPLAALIPDDQHALFFPSFEALVQLADNAGEQGAPVLAAGEARGEDARTRQRYEQQLCLSLNQGARLFGPQLIKSVAMTGADPYLRTGADLAVLFEAREVKTLRTLIDAQVALAGAGRPDAKPVRGDVDGAPYTGMRSSDRSVCSYVATLGDAVVVTNSLAQLKRLVQASKRQIPSLVSLDEYTFFRHRYPRGDDQETALLVISDKTIRRWCGPRWRIGSSRRTRAAAVMSELQAEHLSRLVQGDVQTGPIYTAYRIPEAGPLTLTPDGVRSSTYGGLDFQTPILELDLEFATEEEADFYRRWRDGYQRNWSNYFDPIAVRFYAADDSISADMTIMPLIAGTRYRELIDVSKGASLARFSGDPHAEAVLHAALALNQDSSFMRQNVSVMRTIAPQIKVDPLGWIGDAVAVYVDDDPIWGEMAQLEDVEDFLKNNCHRIPLALYVEVRSGLKLTAFLAGLRAFIEQSAPGMTVWENLTYKDEPYVKISPSQRAKSREDNLEKLAVYYSASGEALLVTLNKDLLFRALDRQIAGRQARADGDAASRSGKAWIGENLCVQADQKIVAALEAVFQDSYRRAMQRIAWDNIPILNEWKRLFPDYDPVQLHERLWRRRLVCPGGGSYRWNETWRTMESTVYGHPGQPKSGPSLPAALQGITGGNFGLTFEDDGLRARAQLTRQTGNR